MSRYSTIHGAFHIEPFPSQPQIAHCHGFYVRHDMRGQGYGHMLKEQQMNKLRELGYDYATCTVDANNAAQLAVLVRAGWEMLTEAFNSKTGGKTQVWGWAVK